MPPPEKKEFGDALDRFMRKNCVETADALDKFMAKYCVETAEQAKEGYRGQPGRMPGGKHRTLIKVSQESGQGYAGKQTGNPGGPVDLHHFMRRMKDPFNRDSPLRQRNDKLTEIYVPVTNPKNNIHSDTGLNHKPGSHPGQRANQPVDKMHVHPKATVNDGNLK